MAITLFEYEPSRPVPWRGVDVLLIALFSFVLQNFVVWLLVTIDPVTAPPAHPPAAPALAHVSHWGELSKSSYLNMKAMAAMAIVNLLVVATAVAYLKGIRGATWADLGWRADKAPQDILRGVSMFALIMIPIYTINALASLILGSETHHPIVDVLSKYPGFFWLCFFSAVVAAPLSEEFLFRGVFQGWLESLPTARTISAQGHSRPLFWPVTMTSFLFALMHFNHGAAPVALFFFSLALGWLYQQTHRLLPSIVLHMSLNGTTMLMLLLAM